MLFINQKFLGISWKKTRKIINCSISSTSELEATEKYPAFISCNYFFSYGTWMCHNWFHHITLLIGGSKRIEANPNRNSGRFYAFFQRPSMKEDMCKKNNDQVTVNLSFLFFSFRWIVGLRCEIMALSSLQPAIKWKTPKTKIKARQLKLYWYVWSRLSFGEAIWNEDE